MTDDAHDDLTDRLTALAARQGDAPFLHASGRAPMSFATLAQRIVALRAQFAGLGLARGDVVAGAVVDRLECAAALAILPASCTYLPLNPARDKASFVELFGRVLPRAVLVPSQRDHPIVAAARELGIAEIAMTPDRGGEAGAFDLALARAAPSLDEPRRRWPPWAYVDVTSGTTGRPKLVPHGHRQLLAQARAMGEWLKLTGEDVAAYTPAVHFALGKRTAFLVPVLNGASVYCLPESDGAALHEAIRGERVTFVPATFAVHRELLERAKASPGRSERLRLLCVASGALDAAETEALERVLDVPALSAYGATEIGTALMQSLDPARRQAGNAGLPMGTEVRIVDANGAVVGDGATGEVQVRGPQVFDGYLDDPALDAAAFDDGWFRMGDLGEREPNGEIRIVGRLHDLINRGGEKIAPARIDEVLRAMPSLADAAAFGVPHPRLGEEIVAAVVVRPGATTSSETVRAHVRDRLGARYAPRRVWIVDALPRTDTGKLRRAALPAVVGFDPATFAATESPDASPASPLELALGGLWAGVLGIARVERGADFFMLGGDSLRGASLVEQVRSVFGVDLPVGALFEDAGTVAGMARRIERERAAKRRSAAPATLPRRTPGAPVPLSHTQARAWFLHRLDPSSDAYHESRLWHVDGTLDVEALRHALALVAERQAILRTRYVVVDGEPRQVVGDASELALDVVDLAAAGAPTLDAAVAEAMSRPFDLGARAPVRFALFRLAPERHAFLRVWHHIANDGLSSPILQDDLSKAYAAVREGRAPAWTPLPVDYADFAAWQRQALGGGALDAAIDAWKRKLADLPTLALPTDRARPPVQSFRGGVVSRRLPEGPVATMKALARQRGATPFMAFLAAYAALLGRLSGDDDFAIGTPVAGRTRPELARLIGFFANTLAFRADLAGNPTFATLVERARDTMVDALSRQDVPFERLVDALGVARDPGRNPIFQVAFSMRESDSGDLVLAGATVRRDEGRHGRAKFDLTLSLVDGRDGVMAHWEYCADLFERATIERMARQYETLVAALASSPEAPLEAHALMDEATRRRVVVDANATATDYPSRTTIHRRVAAQAAARPQAIAIGALDYAALDARASRLAHALVSAGAGPGEFVGVARQKAADTAVAWLAVLKAGAAYVPLDPELPAQRLAFIVADANLRAIVADDVLASRFAQPGVTVVRPDAEAGRIAALPADRADADVAPEAPAYVIYTSGTTGTPKGVVVPHRAVLRLVCGTDYVSLGPGDVVAQLANPAFDASTFEFWGPLANGARIAPIAKTTAIAPRALAAALAAENVTTLFLTTALFNAVARDEPAAFRGCRTVLFGGEAAEPRWVREVLRAGAPSRLLHVYGPTEATTFATWHEVREVRDGAQTVPIGAPIANTEAFVLRAGGEPAAPGEPGELYLGGPGVALGYLGRPELTAERFVERTIAPLPARRLYRTGDRVRRRDDLAIEFLGRRDRQVKVRGHRIELEEIESALARMPQVREAAVTLRGDTSDTRQVVAYLVAADPGGPPPANLLREMRRVLPEFMLPGAIVWLPALPLNASGKVDRRALPPPADAALPDRGVAAPARDLIEGVLVRIWQDLLGRDGIGIHDHFFEIGGHSLLAARLVDTIEKETGYAVPLTAMFADDTIAGLASVLREGAPDAGAPILPVNTGGSRPPFVYLHGDFSGGGFYSRTIAHALGPDQPTLIVHPHGLTEDTIPATIEEMAADRLRAVRAVQPRGPYLVGGHCNGALVAFEMARQLAAAGESVPAVVLIEADAPSETPDDDARPGSYVKFNAPGGPRVLAVRDRATEAELRYTQAMDRYAGRRYEGHVVVIKARDRRAEAPVDMGWSRLAGSVESHFVPGNHTTLITRHVGDLAATIRAALARAVQVTA
ncbi:MAG TPA: amino acid adenylation domain-containing protein [Casimicrobiaceae bacterium]|nr:amino acid adenylation domain-containing protein [Casimicrobiaceae bacterium]